MHVIHARKTLPASAGGQTSQRWKPVTEIKSQQYLYCTVNLLGGPGAVSRKNRFMENARNGRLLLRSPWCLILGIPRLVKHARLQSGRRQLSMRKTGTRHKLLLMHLMIRREMQAIHVLVRLIHGMLRSGGIHARLRILVGRSRSKCRERGSGSSGGRRVMDWTLLLLLLLLEMLLLLVLLV